MSSGLIAELRAAAYQSALELRPTTPPPPAPPAPLFYSFPITCVACGQALRPRTGATSNGRETRAVADCTRCGQIHLVAVTVSSQPGKAPRPVATPRRPPVRRTTDADIEHGTPQGYDQHRNISPPCDDCKAARALKVQADRAARSAARKAHP